MSTCQTTLLPSATEDRRHLWVLAIFSPAILSPLWLATPTQVPAQFQSFGGLVLILLLVCTTVTDLRTRKIYNWATYTACAWGVVLNLMPHPFCTNAIGLSASVCGLVTCFAIMLVPFTLARGGAGDVKLATAIGALLGVGDGMLVIAFAYIVAATSIVGWSICCKGPLTIIGAVTRKFGHHLFPQQIGGPDDAQNLLLSKPIPLAGFFAVAALFVVLDGPAWLRSLS